MIEQGPTRIRHSSIVSSLALAFFGVIAGVGVLAQTTPAHAKSGSVRYSYEKVEIGSRLQWTLVPHAAPELKGEVTTSKVQKAFELLRDNKSKTYGETGITIEGQAPSDLRATIQIDPNKRQYELIIMAESVYTLTELGVDAVTFPDVAQGAVSRQDIPFSAYTVTLPLWRALPELELVDAQIRMPDGRIRSADDVYAEWNEDRSKLAEALYTYLDSSRHYTVRQVVEMLPKLDISYAPEVIPLLQHDDRSIQKSALSTLENKRNREDVLKAVVSLMNETSSEKLARRSAEFLGKANNRTYSVQRWFFLLERGSSEERLEAANTLADWSGDERVPKRLSRALTAEKRQQTSGDETSDEDDTESSDAPAGASSNETNADDTSNSEGPSRDVRTFESALVEALAKHDAHDALIGALDARGVLSDTKLQIAESLAGDSTTRARIPGLRYLAANADGKRAREAVRTLGDIETEAARKAAESFLTARDRRLRLTAIETIRSRGSMQSLSALADAIRETDLSDAKLENAGYQIIARQKIPEILEFTRKSDTIVQRMAYRALGNKAQEGAPTDQIFETIVETLQKGAEHPDPQIRGAAVRGLGAIGNDKALKTFERLADDQSAVVREGVARALENYDKGTMSETLAQYLEDDSPNVVAAALNTIRIRGEGDMWSTFKSLANAEDPRVRRRALEAMAELVPDKEKAKREVISLLSGKVTSDDDPNVLRTALEQLGRFQKERAVNGIAISLNSQNKDLQVTALRALGETGHSSAKELILEQLGASDPAIRRAAVKALRDLGDPSVRSRLQKRLTQESNTDIKRLIEETLQNLQ